MSTELTLRSTLPAMRDFVISRASVPTDDDDGTSTFRIEFSNGFVLLLQDVGQSCCENRYITCDDDLSDIVGDKLVSVECRETTCTPREYDDPHEMAFVYIQTTRSRVVFCTHNEHNGYYGGFMLKATLLDPSGQVVGRQELPDQ